jgi:hypothetical protein
MPMQFVYQQLTDMLQPYNTGMTRSWLAISAVVAIAIQTWFSFFVTANPISPDSRRGVSLVFALAAIVSIVAGAGCILMTDMDNQKEAGDRQDFQARLSRVLGADKKETTGAPPRGNLYDYIDKTQIQLTNELRITMNESCLSPEQVGRMLVLLRLRDEYLEKPEGKGMPGLWPDQDWMNQRLARSGAGWQVCIADGGADIATFDPSVQKCVRGKLQKLPTKP